MSLPSVKARALIALLALSAARPSCTRTPDRSAPMRGSKNARSADAMRPSRRRAHRSPWPHPAKRARRRRRRATGAVFGAAFAWTCLSSSGSFTARLASFSSASHSAHLRWMTGARHAHDAVGHTVCRLLRRVLHAADHQPASRRHALLCLGAHCSGRRCWGAAHCGRPRRVFLRMRVRCAIVPPIRASGTRRPCFSAPLVRPRSGCRRAPAVSSPPLSCGRCRPPS